MTTIFVPRNKAVHGTAISNDYAVLLRRLIPGADINGLGIPLYTPAEVSRRYGGALVDAIAGDPDGEHAEFLRGKAYFFINCRGFWQK